MLTVAHLSDLHVTPVRVQQFRALRNKRVLGWLSWILRRRKHYRPEVLQALIADLQETAPDHIVVTGDLINISLEEEFPAAVPWLHRFGPPDKVFIIPGNHDAYVSVPYTHSWRHWEAYLQSDEAYQPESPSENGTGVAFPTVRIRDQIVFIGVNTALPPAPLFCATGQIGAQQLEKLEDLLRGFATVGLCRVVLIHHPPDEQVETRRRLIDAAAFRTVLWRTGAELVLHGHLHKSVFSSIPGPAGPIPVVGVRSSSAIGHKPRRRARYHVYTIETHPQDPQRFRITVDTRVYDRERHMFVPGRGRMLSML
ncbi:MAG: metallophosphoesterase [Candidatus Binatia bacterium]